MTTESALGPDTRLKEAYDQAARALLTAAGQGDEQMLGHSERVAEYCRVLGKALGLTPAELSDLHYAASLHDIGKIGVSPSIVNKLGSLTESELSAMRLHSIIGIRILENIEGLRGALPFIKHHHERWDGNGYPDGLPGESIPLGARIIAVAETFDIMTSEVPWRHGMAKSEAAEELRRCAGTQFDPTVVEAFLKHVLGEHDPVEPEGKACGLRA